LKEESGYSLIEVVASMLLLTIAIIPMVGMFDAGLRGASGSGNYETARALANLKMEEAKSLAFSNVTTNFPVAGSDPDPTTGYYDSGWQDQSGPTSAAFANFQYRVEKQYMTQPPNTPGSSSLNFGPSTSATNMIRVTVSVRWGSASDYKTFKTYGLVA
jgi:Tfp pilus assembly protein PilV